MKKNSVVKEVLDQQYEEGTELSYEQMEQLYDQTLMLGIETQTEEELIAEMICMKGYD